MSAARDGLDWSAAKNADMVDLAHQHGARLKRSGRFLVSPCPRGCASSDGFIINPDKRLFFCRPSDAKGDAVDMVGHLRGCSKIEALAYITGQPAARRDRANEEARARTKAPVSVASATTTADALGLWRQGGNPRATPAQRYFNVERKLDLYPDLCGEVLRWHSGLGAVLALFRNITTGEPQAVSRIFLDRNARKIKRQFYGPVSGAAIMLDAFEDVLEGLHIGEGVETAMTARQRFDMRPAWALAARPASRAFRFSLASNV